MAAGNWSLPVPSSFEGFVAALKDCPWLGSDPLPAHFGTTSELRDGAVAAF